MIFSNKIFSFGAFPIILAVIFSYFLTAKNLWVVEETYFYFFLILAIGSFFLALFALQIFLIESFLAGSLLIFLEAAAFVAFFLPSINYWTGLAFLIILITFLQSFYFGQKKLANNLSIKINTDSRPIIKRALTGIFFASVLLQTASLNFKTYTVSSSWLTTLKWPIETVSKFFVGGISLDKSLGETVDQLVRRSLPAEFSNSPPEIKNQLVQNATNNLLQRAQAYTFVRFDLEKSVKETIRQTLNVQIQRLPLRFYPFVKIGLTVLIFLALNSISFPLVWLISLVSWFIFYLLLSAKFIKITTQLREAEKVIF